MSTLLFIVFDRANSLYVFPYFYYYFLKDCIRDSPSNSPIMSPFAQDPHLYSLSACCTHSRLLAVPTEALSAWKQREKLQKNLMVSLSNDKPNSFLPDFCQVHTPFSGGVVQQHVEQDHCCVDDFFSPIAPPPPPSAFVLCEQSWCGCCRERLMGHSDCLKARTSKGQPTRALTKPEGLSTNITRARNTSAAEEKC